MSRLNENPLLRRIAMPVLQKLGDRRITIRHHWTGAPLTLNVFRHRGYWYFGKARERSTIERARALVPAGGTVVELGGHIGYLAMIFADAVGQGGRVIVFEPGSVNLDYTRANLGPLSQVTLEELAVADFEGRTTFYSEDLSGQNSSLVGDYSVGQNVAENAHVQVNRTEETVTVTTLDAYCSAHGIAPDFIKIDIEGAELSALKGAERTLAEHRPALMVEVTEHVSEVLSFLDGLGYRLETPEGETVHPDTDELIFNVFALPKEAG
ncbi:MAG: FkbM family methyltransferase [Paracoccaceae bacterium]